MKSTIFYSIILIYIAYFNFNCEAQSYQDSVLYLIETVDDNSFTGYIIEKDTDTIKIRTEKYGFITLSMENVKGIESLEEVKKVKGKYWLPNPQSTRYFWSPNAYGLERGEAYYQNVWIFFNQVAFGVTDNFSLGGGMIPLFLFSGASTPVWITPKFSLPVIENALNLGAGALIGKVLGAENAGFGIVYGMSTFGSRNQNLSIGLGYGYAGGDWGNSPTVNINGIIRTGPKGYLISENYFIPFGNESELVLSFGGRSILKKVGIDYCLIIPTNTGGATVLIPFLGITIPFGNKTYQAH